MGTGELSDASLIARCAAGDDRARHQDGSWHWFEANVHSHRNAQGELRVVMISRDVTERKTAEERRRPSSRPFPGTSG